ncbi:MAG: class I SAM-dependent methyltransferase [Terracidiphilus sp.]|jgi:ubiquinone/menaquinone biosynthesis C-methylase UbiE
MTDCATPRLLPVEEAYQLWAPIYDATPNPLFTLEERHLAPLLLPTPQSDVVDLGCGTGRWLKRISALRPRSLIGVDNSPAMLEWASSTHCVNARLVPADCSNTQLATTSADLILASFLLSYVKDLRKFARETARISRPGSLVVFSDVHPATTRYGWKRTFRSAQQLIEIKSYKYRIHDLHEAMKASEFEIESSCEYCFGDEEKAVFRQAGRQNLFEAVRDLPVLLVVRYRRR